MAYTALDDMTKWDVYDISSVQLTFSGGGTQSINGVVLEKGSSFSITPIESSAKSNQGHNRTVGYLLTADLQVVQNNYDEISDNLDFYLKGKATDIGLVFSNGLTISFDQGVATGDFTHKVTAEIKTDNDQIPTLRLQLRSMITIKNISTLIQ